MKLVTTFSDVHSLLDAARRYDRLAEIEHQKGTFEGGELASTYGWIALFIRRRARLSLNAI